MAKQEKKIKEIIQKNKYLKVLLIQLAILLVLVFLFMFVHSSLIDFIPPCYWQEHFGLLCPSCGSTRCIIHFLEGNFLTAFSYNPFLFILIVYFLILDIVFIINTLFEKKFLKFLYPKWWYIIVYFSLWTIYTIYINF